MNAILWLYGIYTGLSLVLTVWVAATLHRNGRVFLVDAFGGNEELADSVNHLLVVGFYLVNLGFVALALKTGLEPAGTREVVEILSRKMGVVLLVLGGMHFFNLFVLSRIRRRGLLRHAAPPVLPKPLTEA